MLMLLTAATVFANMIIARNVPARLRCHIVVFIKSVNTVISPVFSTVIIARVKTIPNILLRCKIFIELNLQNYIETC